MYLLKVFLHKAKFNHSVVVEPFEENKNSVLFIISGPSTHYLLKNLHGFVFPKKEVQTNSRSLLIEAKSKNTELPDIE